MLTLPKTSMSKQLICEQAALSDGACLEFELDGKPCFAVSYDGNVFAYINACPHLNIELNWQENQFLDADNALIQCATHGALFTLDNGLCVSGPCVNQSLLPVNILCENGKIYAQSH